MRFTASLHACLACGILSVVSSAQKPHVLLISIDGMRPDYTTQAAAHGLHMPTLGSFMRDGSFAEGVLPVWPSVTYPDHTTLVTGVTPSEHGIYNNSHFDPLNEHPGENYKEASEIQVETLWQAAKEAGLTTASVSWPVTNDSRFIDYDIGAHAETTDGAKAGALYAHPASLVSELDEGLAKEARGKGDALHTRWAVQIIHRYQPNFMTVHLVETDEAQHNGGPFSAEANEAMERADGEIRALADAERSIDPAATVIVVSDHGFAHNETKVNLFALFVSKGLITLQSDSADNKHPKIASWIAAPWISGGSCAIVLRDPKSKEDADRVYRVLKEAQANPALGILRIVKQAEITKHGGNPRAAFFVDFRTGFSTGENYSVGDTGDTELTKSAGGKNGVHGYLPDTEPQMRASFFADGKNIRDGKNLGVIDMRQIAPTIARLLTVRLPQAKQIPLDVISR